MCKLITLPSPPLRIPSLPLHFPALPLYFPSLSLTLQSPPHCTDQSLLCASPLHRLSLSVCELRVVFKCFKIISLFPVEAEVKHF